MPDLVFPRRRAVLFAHGCFWHGHGCHLFKWPSSRAEFWHTKITRNAQRDREVQQSLAREQWRVGLVWECALKGRTRMPIEEVLDRCEAWLLSQEPHLEIAGDETRVSV